MRGSGRKEGKSDGLSGSVGAIIFADGTVSGGGGGVGYVCCACGAASAVEAEGEGGNGGNAREEVLLR